MPLVAVDARMIHHSGIGVVLHGLAEQWSHSAPNNLDFLFCGNKEQLLHSLPSTFHQSIIPWNPSVYSLKAALLAPEFKKKPDVWYSPHYATCLRTNLPLVCHIQDVLHITHPTKLGTSIYNRLYLSALKRQASFTLTTSRHVKVQLQTLYGFPPEKVLITGLGPGIHSDKENAGNNLPKELVGKKYLLAVGIYKPHKNWNFLLEQFKKANREGLNLVCAGLGKGGEKLVSLGKRLGIDDKLIVLPKMKSETLKCVYQNSQGLVFPSLAEGFGLPVLEAMSLNVPIIIADRSPMKEIAENSAFTFDPDYPDSFQKALCNLLENHQLRCNYMENGKNRSTLYTWKKTVGIVNQALERALH
jgi:glycosyltransferase involved in cell wall biosynthesis